MHPLLANLRLELHTASRSRLGPSWRATDPGQPFARLYLPLEGGGTVEHHGHLYPLRPHLLHLIPAQTPLRYACPDNMLISWCHFSAQVFGGIDLFRHLHHTFEWAPDDPSATVAHFDRLIALNDLPGLQPAFERNGLLTLLLTPFVAGLDQATSASPEQRMRRFRPVLQHIEAHLAEPLRIPDLARLAHLEESYFSTRFARDIGVPPLRYIHQRRIQRAMRRLWETDDTLDVIAADLGYTDASHFSRTFKRLTGSSPRDFRTHPGMP